MRSSISMENTLPLFSPFSLDNFHQRWFIIGIVFLECPSIDTNNTHRFSSYLFHVGYGDNGSWTLSWCRREGAHGNLLDVGRWWARSSSSSLQRLSRVSSGGYSVGTHHTRSSIELGSIFRNCRWIGTNDEEPLFLLLILCRTLVLYRYLPDLAYQLFYRVRHFTFMEGKTKEWESDDDLTLVIQKLRSLYQMHHDEITRLVSVTVLFLVYNRRR